MCSWVISDLSCSYLQINSPSWKYSGNQLLEQQIPLFQMLPRPAKILALLLSSRGMDALVFAHYNVESRGCMGKIGGGMAEKATKSAKINGIMCLEIKAVDRPYICDFIDISEVVSVSADICRYRKNPRSVPDP